MKLLTILVLAMGLRLTAALEAYDCDDPSVQISPLDLRRPAQCQDPDQAYLSPKKQLLQIAKTDTAHPITGYQCKMHVSKQATKCGILSTTYGAIDTLYKHQIRMNPEECLRAIKQGTVFYQGRTFHPTPGEVFNEVFFSRGSVDRKGNCETEEWRAENGMNLNGHYETTKMHIHLANVRGKLDTATNTVVFNNGIRADYNQEILHDAFEGTIIWEADTPDCHDTTSTISLSTVDLYRKDPGSHVSPSNTEAILMLEDQTTNQYAGLIIKHPIFLCGVPCYNTQMDGIIVCLLENEQSPTAGKRFVAGVDQDMAFTRLSSQQSFLHIGTNLNINKRLALIQDELCQINRVSLFNKLQAMSGLHNPHALQDIYGPGHQVVIAGAAAYVSKCKAVPVTRVDHPNCTHEIPVLTNGLVRFADPITWILKDLPTILPCDTITPVLWNIQDNWVCSTPLVRPCHDPTQLKPNTTTFVTPSDFTIGLGDDLYSETQRAEHKLFNLMTNSRQSFTTKGGNLEAANAEYRETGNGPALYPGLPFNPEDLDKISWSVGSFLSPFYSLMGDFYIWGSTICIGLMALRMLINAVRQMRATIESRGCGWWVACAICEVTYGCIAAPLTISKNALKIAFAPIEDIKSEDPVSKQQLTDIIRALAGGRSRTRPWDVEGQQLPLTVQPTSTAPPPPMLPLQ